MVELQGSICGNCFRNRNHDLSPSDQHDNEAEKENTAEVASQPKKRKGKNDTVPQFEVDEVDEPCAFSDCGKKCKVKKLKNPTICYGCGFRMCGKHITDHVCYTCRSLNRI